MKTCSFCKEQKPKTEFNANIYHKDGLQDKCRECSRQYSRSHYRKNPEYYLERNRQRRQALRNWLLEYKGHLACSRCGECRLPCLESHHVNSDEKDFCIAIAIQRGYSIERVKKEIDKCEVLCANCHAVEHWHGGLVCPMV